MSSLGVDAPTIQGRATLRRGNWGTNLGQLDWDVSPERNVARSTCSRTSRKRRAHCWRERRSSRSMREPTASACEGWGTLGSSEGVANEGWLLDRLERSPFLGGRQGHAQGAAEEAEPVHRGGGRDPDGAPRPRGPVSASPLASCRRSTGTPTRGCRSGMCG